MDRSSQRAQAAIGTSKPRMHNTRTTSRNDGTFLMIGARIHAGSCTATVPARVGSPGSRPSVRYAACFTRRNTIVPVAIKSKTSMAMPQVETVGMGASPTVIVPRMPAKTWGSQM